MHETLAKKYIAKALMRSAYFAGIPKTVFITIVASGSLCATLGFMLTNRVFISCLILIIASISYLIMRFVIYKEDEFALIKWSKIQSYTPVLPIKSERGVNAYDPHPKSLTSFLKKEQPLLGKLGTISDKIPFLSHLDDENILTTEGHVFQVIEVCGIAYETKAYTELNLEENLRAHLLKSISDPSISLYLYTKREKCTSYPDGNYIEHFSKHLNEKYKKNIENRQFYANRHYIVVLKRGSLKQNIQKRLMIALNQVTDRLISSLSIYGARRLRVTPENDVKYSEILSFLYELINAKEAKIRLTHLPLNTYLPQANIFFSNKNGFIQWRGIDGTNRFGAILILKEYPDFSSHSMLNALKSVEIEYLLTQTFFYEDKQSAKAQIKEQQKSLQQVQDEAHSEHGGLDFTLDKLASNQVSLGYHSLSILVFDEDIKSLEKKLKKIDSLFLDEGMICYRETSGIELSFFAQMPGNFKYLYRKAPITTENIAGFFDLHNSPKGHTKTWWGNALTICETASGAPYYLNIHHLDVANCLFIGAQGVGKTLLMSFLLTIGMKYGGRRFIFDKDGSMQIIILALSGKYVSLTPGVKAGLAPFQLPDTVENRNFLVMLIQSIASSTGGFTILADHLTLIQKAVEGMYQLPQSDRVFSNLLPFLGRKESGSLRNQLEPWCGQGAYAWLFDNETDSFEFNRNLVGVDIGKILEEKYQTCCAPALLYFMHRLKNLFDGSPSKILIPEVWLLLKNEYFRSEIDDWSKTPRKKNIALLFDLQNVDDLEASPEGRAFIRSVVTKCLYAGFDESQRQICEDLLSLTPQEFNLLKSLNKTDRLFLFKQGHDSVLLRLNLSDLDDEIAVLSARPRTVQCALDAIARHGENPVDWLPFFYKHWRDYLNYGEIKT
jgi:type IV secretion system protein VirB4